MRVRVIAGYYGGRMIDAPRGRTTHPMSERIRGAMFNSLINEVPGATVLDAYAGTGVVGFEALSRGAAHVVAIERHRVAQKIIAANAETLGIEDDKFTLHRGRVQQYISSYEGEGFDIIFADPPYYNYIEHLSTVERLFGLLKPEGLMVLSKPGTCEEAVLPNRIVVVDNRSYGDAQLSYYRRESA